MWEKRGILFYLYATNKERIMDNFVQTDPADVTDNFIRTIGQEWMLVTAGDAASCNTMTASWGFVGEMWGRPAAMVVLRPTRYTKEFVDREERLTLSFFGPEYRKALAYCGAHSGRDGDKIAAAGLTVVMTDDGVPAFAQARLVLQCRKMYADRFREENFTGPEPVGQWYPAKDFHTFYVLEIEKAYIR